MDRSAYFLVAAISLLAACSRTDPAISTQDAAPVALVTAAGELRLKNVFVNPSARPAMGGADLAVAAPDDDTASRDASAWRKLDRDRRFDGVLLAGPLVEFRPLLAHLVESPDFRLVRVDHWGFLFTRQRPVPYEPPPSESIIASSDEIRADIASQTAIHLNEAGLPRAASNYMDAALKSAPDYALVRARAAALALARNRHREAIEQADAALALDPHQITALEVKARALAAVGAADAAWQVAEQLRTAAPADDMNVLYLHARLANTATAYSREQDSLERLVKLAESRNLPSATYRVHLGQCYARQGLARPALEQLEKAAREPGLTDTQKADIETAIAAARQHAGDLSH